MVRRFVAAFWRPLFGVRLEPDRPDAGCQRRYCDRVSHVSLSELTARADRALAELVEVLAAARELETLAALAVLVAMVRASAELRIRAEHAIGQLLAAHPDAGGRPSPSRPCPVGRQLRRALDINRPAIVWLTRLGSEVDDARLDSIVSEVWAGYPAASKVSARSVVSGERMAESSEPPPSRTCIE